MLSMFFVFFFFKQKTAYEMRISDWSSDVCSSDLDARGTDLRQGQAAGERRSMGAGDCAEPCRRRPLSLSATAECAGNFASDPGHSILSVRGHCHRIGRADHPRPQSGEFGAVADSRLLKDRTSVV